MRARHWTVWASILMALLGAAALPCAVVLMKTRAIGTQADLNLRLAAAVLLSIAGAAAISVGWLHLRRTPDDERLPRTWNPVLWVLPLVAFATAFPFLLPDPLRMNVLVAATLVCLTPILLLPLQCVLIVGTRQFLLKPLEPAVYRPIEAHKLPLSARPYIERQSAALAALGFRTVGDFCVRRTRPHFARLFLNREGSIGAEVTVASVIPWRTLRVTALFSLLDDLVCVETGDQHAPDLGDCLLVRGLNGATPEQLLEAHREQLARAQTERGTTAIRLTAEEAPLVTLYMAALTHERLVEEGIAAENSYAETMGEIRAAVERLVPEPVG